MTRAAATRVSSLAACVVATVSACNGRISGGASATGAAGAGANPPATGVAGGGAVGVAVSGGAGTGGGNVDLAAALADTKASSVVRMLSQRELGNALEALVGFRPASLSMLPSDKHDLVYDRVVESQTVSSLHEDAFEAIADEIADKLLANDLADVATSCKPAAALGTDGAALGTARRPCIAALSAAPPSTPSSARRCWRSTTRRRATATARASCCTASSAAPASSTSSNSAPRSRAART
jgi:hypothetical protein